jgi:hypothetical protein
MRGVVELALLSEFGRHAACGPCCEVLGQYVLSGGYLYRGCIIGAGEASCGHMRRKRNVVSSWFYARRGVVRGRLGRPVINDTGRGQNDITRLTAFKG